MGCPIPNIGLSRIQQTGSRKFVEFVYGIQLHSIHISTRPMTLTFAKRLIELARQVDAGQFEQIFYEVESLNRKSFAGYLDEYCRNFDVDFNAQMRAIQANLAALDIAEFIEPEWLIASRAAPADRYVEICN